MLRCFVSGPHGLREAAWHAGESAPNGALWVDLRDPTADEERAVEGLLGLNVPTREEMREIEASSRLRVEEGGLIMTATVLAGSEGDRPEAAAVTFIRTPRLLATVRYSDPRSFQTFVARAERHAASCASADAVLLGLLDAIVDRSADILERIAGDLDHLSHLIFRRAGSLSLGPNGTAQLLRRVGQQGDLIGMARESVGSMSRLIPFLGQNAKPSSGGDFHGRIDVLGRDLATLADHLNFLNGKVTFLLDATLGTIGIQQTNIIKTFSVASVVFLPPTLIASIYGMNFRFMPELAEPWGYPLAIAAMVASAILPYVYFKRRGWL